MTNTTLQEKLPTSANEVVEKSKADVRSELLKNPENVNRPDPFNSGDFLSAIPIAQGNRIYDFYVQLEETFRLNMPHTAEGQSAEDWGNIFLGSHLPEKPAEGNLIVTGTVDSIVPNTRKYTASNGFEYEIVETYKIAENSLSASSYSLNGNVLEISFDSEHFISSECELSVTGLTPTDYNKTYENPFVKDSKTIQVESPSQTNPTGDLSLTFEAGRVYVRAILDENLNGSNSNAKTNESFNIDIPVSGVDDTAIVSGSALKGGYDYETESQYQKRYLDRMREPVAHFNDADIKKVIQKSLRDFKLKVFRPGDTIGEFSISGIVRNSSIAIATTSSAHGLFTGAKITIEGASESEYNVDGVECLYIDDFNFAFVVDESATTPATGTITCNSVVPLGRTQVYVYGEGEQKILDSSDVNLAKAEVEKIIPGNTPNSFVTTKTPSASYVDFTFSDISPDNSEMREAIKESLLEYFDDVDVNEGLDEDAYKSAIISTVVPSTGQKLKTYTLSNPSGDVDKVYGALLLLGQVNFS